MKSQDIEKLAKIIIQYPLFPEDNMYYQLGIIKSMNHKEKFVLSTEQGKIDLRKRAMEIFLQARAIFPGNPKSKSPFDMFFFYSQAGKIIIEMGRIEVQQDEVFCSVTLRVQRENMFLPFAVLKTAYRCRRNEDLKKIVETSIASHAVSYHVPYSFL